MKKYTALTTIAAVLVPENAHQLQRAAALQRLGKRWDPTYSVKPGFLYVRSRAISSRTNDNYDTFPAEEIKKGYKTFIGKPVFVNHVNDNHRRARGIIIDAVLHEDMLSDGAPDTWCEVLMEVDAKSFPKLAEAILAGRVNRTSMGTDVAYSVCSACGNKATTEAEYCFPPGQLVLMADGTYRPIETLRPGDSVLTHSGVGTVTALGERHYKGKMARIWRVGSSYPVVATEGHKFLANLTGKPEEGKSGDARFRSIASEENWGRVEARHVQPGTWVQSTYPTEESDFLIDVLSLSSAFTEIGGRVVLSTPTTSGSKRRLTNDQVEEIKKRRANGESGASLASQFAVSQAMISLIVNGKAYAEEPPQRVAWTSASLDRWISPSHPLSILLGYYIAEGSLAAKAPSGDHKVVEWALHGSEEWIADEIEVALSKLDAGDLKRYRPSPTRLIVKVSNAPLAALLSYLAGTTTSASRAQKVLSGEVVLAPLDFQATMMRAYLNGDGWDQTTDHCEARTASDLLARQITLIGARLFSQVPTVFRNEKNPGGPTNRAKMSVINHVAVRMSPTGYMNGRRRLSDGYYASRVSKVEEFDYHGEVYNITVDHQHTYAVEDMVVFNCNHIPRLKGKKIIKRDASTGMQQEHLINEICYGLKFFENSLLVEPPADPTAHLTGIDDSGLRVSASLLEPVPPRPEDLVVHAQTERLKDFFARTAAYAPGKHPVDDNPDAQKVLSGGQRAVHYFVPGHGHGVETSDGPILDEDGDRYFGTSEAAHAAQWQHEKANHTIYHPVYLDEDDPSRAAGPGDGYYAQREQALQDMHGWRAKNDKGYQADLMHNRITLPMRHPDAPRASEEELKFLDSNPTGPTRYSSLTRGFATMSEGQSEAIEGSVSAPAPLPTGLTQMFSSMKPQPFVSGVVLKAGDTGRVLMLQRSLKDESDPARGTWEFPGGHHEDGDTTSLHAGIREWEEEVGQPFPKGGVVSHTWRSPNGVYQGHVVVIPEESQVALHEGRVMVNPDDPDGDDAEQAAWWDPEHAKKNPALRKEVKSAPWDALKKASSLMGGEDHSSDDTHGTPVLAAKHHHRTHHHHVHAASHPKYNPGRGWAQGWGMMGMFGGSQGYCCPGQSCAGVDTLEGVSAGAGGDAGDVGDAGGLSAAASSNMNKASVQPRDVSIPTVLAAAQRTVGHERCGYCDSPATQRLLWAEGMAYIPTCDEHEPKGRHQIEVTNHDEVNGVKKISLRDAHALRQHLMEEHGYSEDDFWRSSHSHVHTALQATAAVDRPLSLREVRSIHDWEHGRIPNDDPHYRGGIPGHFAGDLHSHTALRKQADEDQCPYCSGDSLPTGSGYTCQDCGRDWSPDDPAAQAYHGDGPQRGRIQPTGSSISSRLGSDHRCSDTHGSTVLPSHEASGPMGQSNAPKDQGPSNKPGDHAGRQMDTCVTCGSDIHKVQDHWQHSIDSGAGVPHQAIPTTAKTNGSGKIVSALNEPRRFEMSQKKTAAYDSECYGCGMHLSDFPSKCPLCGSYEVHSLDLQPQPPGNRFFSEHPSGYRAEWKQSAPSRFHVFEGDVPVDSPGLEGFGPEHFSSDLEEKAKHVQQHHIDRALNDWVEENGTGYSKFNHPDLDGGSYGQRHGYEASRKQAGVEKGTPEYKGHYNRGWAAGNRGSGLEAADNRGEPDAWYDGYMDAATSRPKWSLMHHDSAEAADAALDRGWVPTSKIDKQAYGEIKAPADVDTLRDAECPVCGNDSDSFDGDQCQVCFSPETLVRTRDGFVPISTVEPGDFVLSAGGVWRRVAEVLERDYDGVAYWLKSSQMTSPVLITPEHPVSALVHHHPRGGQQRIERYLAEPVSRAGRGSSVHRGVSWYPKYQKWMSYGRLEGKSKTLGYFATEDEAAQVAAVWRAEHPVAPEHHLGWVEAKDLSLDSYVQSAFLADQERRDLQQVSVPAEYLGRLRRDGSRVRKGPAEFTLTDDFLWIIGLYLAEGSAGARHIDFALHEKEVEYIDRIEKFFGSFGYSTVVKDRDGHRGVWVDVYSSTLAEWFPRWFGSGSHNKSIPAELMSLPLDRLIHVWRGVLDGDGTNARNQFGQTSEVLALQVAEISLLLGSMPTINSHLPKDRKRVYKVIGTGFDGKKVTSKKGATTWRGDILAKVRSIEPTLYSGKVYNLRVEGDPTYVVQNMLVHNCGFVTPPRMFQDPDLTRARILDLRANPATGIPNNTDPTIQPGQDPDAPLDPNMVGPDGQPLAGEDIEGQEAAEVQADSDNDGVVEGDVRGLGDAGEPLDPSMVDEHGMPIDPAAAEGRIPQGGDLFTQGPNAPTPQQFAEPGSQEDTADAEDGPIDPADIEAETDADAEPGEVAADGQAFAPQQAPDAGEPGFPGDAVPDLICPACGFQAPGASPLATSTDAQAPSAAPDGMLEGDACPQCGQAALMGVGELEQMQQMMSGQQPAAPM